MGSAFKKSEGSRSEMARKPRPEGLGEGIFFIVRNPLLTGALKIGLDILSKGLGQKDSLWGRVSGLPLRR